MTEVLQRDSETVSEHTIEDVTVVMATMDEEAAIESVLTDIAHATDGQAEVICVDSSTDRTPDIARSHGATVIDQEPGGYGVAVSRALEAASSPIIVTTDCDDTYPMSAIPTFVGLINDGYDVVSGDRLYHGAATMPAVNRIGNEAFALLASVLSGHRVHDTTTGMRAYRREVVDTIEWTENTGLSAELLLRPLMRGYRISEVPIQYRERTGTSKLDPLAGGVAIGTSIVRVCMEERLR